MKVLREFAPNEAKYSLSMNVEDEYAARITLEKIRFRRKFKQHYFYHQHP